MTGADWYLEEAKRLYERALFEGDTAALREASEKLDAVDASLSVARGRVIHGRILAERASGGYVDSSEEADELEMFERATKLFRQIDDLQGEAESLFWVGCFHQVVRRDNAIAVPLLERSLALATQVDDRATMSDALRHLGIAQHSDGHLSKARDLLSESSRLRTQSGNLVGVAANMVGLIYIARAEGRVEDARELAGQARAIAIEYRAQVLVNQVDEALGS